MKRREFVAGLVAIVPLLSADRTRAQSRATIGVLLPRDAEEFWTVFRDGLRERGYIEGQNVHLELRVAGDKSLSELASELVRLKVAAIVAHQTPAAQAAKNATRDIPIVAAAGDLVATGLVASLSHPGGNVTGVSGMTAELAGKSVELLREALPGARRLAVLANRTDRFTRPLLDHVMSAASATELEVRQFLLGGPDDLDKAFADLDRDRVDAMIVQPSVPRRRAFELGVARAIATTSPFPGSAAAGALLSYNADTNNFYRRVAEVLDRVLKGSDPASIPVALPTKFYLSLNLKTAQKLGVTIPPSLLASADEVIE